jgi:hypothetical protein
MPVTRIFFRLEKVQSIAVITVITPFTPCSIGPVLYSACLLQRTMKDPFDLAVDTAKFIRRPFLDGLHRLCIYT